MDTPAKQQVVERLKAANNVLVTVSTNPSVDQLAACIGLTLLLNKTGKHATAIFSGRVPSTIEFLQPEKTLVANTDSLRDFIISLDKSKADKLRYKVEDQVVRIFITPYKTGISEKDLVFSQGDFNVEVVMALGVHDRTQLDAAITAHGRILHDATVVSASAGSVAASSLGQINWQDATASSLSEMIVSISEALGSGLIDNQMATAFLTGIVAETDRFSNSKTSPKVMTMSAQLMAAGANQQLIVSKLNPPPPPPIPKPTPPPSQPPTKKRVNPPHKSKVEPLPKEDKTTLSVSHEPTKPDGPEVQLDPNEIHIDEQGNLKTAAELQAEIDRLEKLKAQKAKEAPPPPPVPKVELEPIEVEQAPAMPPEPPPPPPIPQPTEPPPPTSPDSSETTPQHALLSPIEGRPMMSTPFTANTSDQSRPTWAAGTYPAPVDPLNNPSMSGHDQIFDHARTVLPSSVPPAPVSESQSPFPAQTAPNSVDHARSAVESALSAQPFDAVRPTPIEALGAQPMGPDLHNQPSAPPSSPNGSTPSLSLPQNGNTMPPPPTPPPLPPFPPMAR